MNHRIMLVGVVPPPIHGQSMATQALFDADLSPLEKMIVPIRSSKSLDSVGRFSLNKALGLVGIISSVWWKWIRKRPRVLYYTAGSGAWVPFARDFLFLSLCRPLFRTTLIHYHSGNLVEFLEESKFRSALGQYIYGRGAWTIRLGEFCPAPFYEGNQRFDVPNGIAVPENLPTRTSSETFRILFLGNLFEDKGVLDLISAVALLATQSPQKPFQLSLIGGWPDETTKDRILKALADLPSNVQCPPPAPAYGAEKWRALSEHDVLAFPSYYSSENLPLVIIEAMAAGLPVVASDWRGIPSLVIENETGFLFPPKQVAEIVSSLQKIADEPLLKESLGKQARARYQEHFQLRKFTETLHNILTAAVLGVSDSNNL